MYLQRVPYDNSLCTGTAAEMVVILGYQSCARAKNINTAKNASSACRAPQKYLS